MTLGFTPLVSLGLNVIAVGGLAPTLWDWRKNPVRRWFVLGAGVGDPVGWIAMLAVACAQRPTPSSSRLTRAAADRRRQRSPLVPPEQNVLPTRNHGRGRPSWPTRRGRRGLHLLLGAGRSAGLLGPDRARPAPSNSSCATGATGRMGRSNSGSISSLAASSIAVTVPPCAPGENRK